MVYDPDAGFVTGGGWIDSESGAYADATVPGSSSMSGKAQFGLVSKYQKGASVPEGETQFNFNVGGLDFHSTSYDWQVVSGATARYKGVGSVNGESGYGFLLFATDGQVNGGGGVDRFRIKIRRISTGEVIYDNNRGASETSAPATAISKGSILVHAK